MTTVKLTASTRANGIIGGGKYEYDGNHDCGAFIIYVKVRTTPDPPTPPILVNWGIRLRIQVPLRSRCIRTPGLDALYAPITNKQWRVCCRGCVRGTCGGWKSEPEFGGKINVDGVCECYIVRSAQLQVRVCSFGGFLHS